LADLGFKEGIFIWLSISCKHEHKHAKTLRALPSSRLVEATEGILRCVMSGWLEKGKTVASFDHSPDDLLRSSLLAVHTLSYQSRITVIPPTASL
jgi:hypothetical protein